MAHTRKQKKKSRPAWGKIGAILLAAALLAAAWRYTPLSDLLTMERISAWARVMRETKWAPAALILAYTPAALLMFPRQLITLAAVIAFGPWWGFGYSLAGVLLAAFATYVAGRWLRYETVRKICGDELDTARDVAKDHGVLTVFALNLSPVPPFAVQGVMAGAMRVTVWQYGLGTLLSMIPGLVAITVFGRELAGFLEEPSKASYWTMGAAVVLFAAFTWGMKRWLSKREQQRAGT